MTAGTKATANSIPISSRLSAIERTPPRGKLRTAGTILVANTITRPSRPSDALLLVAADSLDRAEGLRIALSNQLRALKANQGIEGTHEQRELAVLLDGISRIEHGCVLMMQRAMRTNPLYPWVKRQPGLGEKQMGRLLAVLGDPYWHRGQERPRTVSELWAYCGYHVVTAGQFASEAHTTSANGHNGAALASGRAHTQAVIAGVAPSHRKHEKGNWNAAARMRAYLVAESCVKQPAGSRYRDVYDATRVKYQKATHAVACPRCGPKGHPALAGSILSLGHQHARALRAIAKEVLRDLWLESKHLHELEAA